jgi:hypothetical protein
MHRPSRVLSCLLLAALTGPLGGAMSDAEMAAGRLALRHNADAVVVVKATILLKISVGDRNLPPRENKVEVSATMISSHGLTVTSLSQIDPQATFEALRGPMAMQGTAVDLDQGEIKDVKLRLPDGTEIPARVLWKDGAHDLALVVPSGADAGKREFAHVNLEEAPEAASLLGAYFLVSRAGEPLLRTAMVQPTTIVGIIDRPHRMILLTAEAVGCPVFDLQGRVLGVCVRHTVKGLPVGSVLAPAADIVNAANAAMGVQTP